MDLFRYIELDENCTDSTALLCTEWHTIGLLFPVDPWWDVMVDVFVRSSIKHFREIFCSISFWA
jgi:hypothetical protein